jgi:hypothetical protein
MSRLGQAVLAVTGAIRINYALFGNVEPALHAHVFPRLASEPEHLRTANPWGYDWSRPALRRGSGRRPATCPARAPGRHRGAGHANSVTSIQYLDERNRPGLANSGRRGSLRAWHRGRIAAAGLSSR